jgi:hypothetical protein
VITEFRKNLGFLALVVGLAYAAHLIAKAAGRPGGIKR